jgi:hypothetical protein
MPAEPIAIVRKEAEMAIWWQGKSERSGREKKKKEMKGWYESRGRVRTSSASNCVLAITFFVPSASS